MKLVVCDWDGTLYPTDRGVFYQNIQAIHQWISYGNGFAIASSREIDGADALFAKIDAKGDFIGSNGGQIRFQDGRTIYRPLDPMLLMELKRYQDHYDFTYQFMSQGIVYGSDHTHFPYIHNPHHIHMQPMHALFDPDHINEYCITQIKILVDPRDRDPLKTILNKHFRDRYTITTSDIDMVDIMASGVDKASGIQMIQDHYGLTKDDIYVCGDGENDICMFQQYPNHCVMDSAESFIFTVAKHHAPSVASAIHHWLDQDVQ